MGHTRVGVLPATRRWESLRALLEEGGDAGAVADAALRAVVELLGDADRDLRGRLAREPGLVQSLWVLMTLPSLARRVDFAAALADAGLRVPERAWSSPIGFVAEVTRSVERGLGDDAGTFSTIALAALRQVLTERLGRSGGSLFETSQQEITRTWAEYGTPARFSALAQDYMATFLERATQFYISREVPQQLGAERRFGALSEIGSFNAELAVWARERAAIVTDFAKSWLSKELFERGRPSPKDAQGFVGYALAKVGSEVRAHTPEP